MLFVQLKPADVACGKATLRTSPSSGQAAISFQLRHPKLLACHSRAALALRKIHASGCPEFRASRSSSCWRSCDIDYFGFILFCKTLTLLDIVVSSKGLEDTVCELK